MNAIHDFLVDSENGLCRAARQLPTVRDYIEQLPETAGTFRLTNIDDVEPQFFDDIHVEFLKSWPVHEFYDTSDQRSNRYVNPNYIHAHTFTDLVVECECGAQLTRNYDDKYNALQTEHDHDNTCLPFYRLRARADMQQRRYHGMKRLGWLGWKGSDMAARFGTKSDYLGALARDLNLNLRDCYDRYREAAAHTYKLLVIDHDVSSHDVAATYGHAPSTLTRWANEYTDYETEVGRNQYS